MNTLQPQDITELTVVHTDDPAASWPVCAEAWRFDAQSSGFPAEIIGEEANGTPIVSHNDQTYMLSRRYEKGTGDWFITAKTMTDYQRERGWIR